MFPAIIGLLRWSNLRPSDKPIVAVCLFFVVNELVKTLVYENGYIGYATYNVGALITSMLYLWLFVSWGIFASSKKVAGFVAASFVAVWLFDHFLFTNIHKFSFVFRLYLAISLIVMSLMHLNNLIATEKKSLLTNGRFIITSVILVYNVYRIIVDTFNRAGFSNEFLKDVSDAHRFILIGLYLFYLIGILCLPKKKAFFMPS